MTKPRNPVTAPRKLPSQQRSSELVAAILAAAIRVLEREGASRFTTIRVAEVAGVSVGSLYQYFPNKQAILFRLQLDEWHATSAMLDAILADRALTPQQRLRAAVRAFFRSECDEAPLRLALADAAPAYRDAPETRTHRARGNKLKDALVAAAAPRATAAQRAFAGEVIFATMTSLGKHVSEQRPSRARVDRWADAVSAMLVAYLAQLQ
jgi:AcrR family transcriptional regulator